MRLNHWTGLLLGAAAVLITPSVAATDSGRPGMQRPGPWLDVALSQAGTDAATAALHERARRSYERIIDVANGG